MKVATDKILVRLHKQGNKTKGGFMLPSKVKIVGTVADVIDVGPYVTKVQPGEQIVLGRDKGTKITYNEEELRVINEYSIISIINKNKEEK